MGDANLVRNLQLLVSDLLVHALHVPIVERCDSSEHLIHDGADGPPISGVTMAFASEKLGGDVSWRADEIVGLLGEAQLSGHSKVDNL